MIEPRALLPVAGPKGARAIEGATLNVPIKWLPDPAELTVMGIYSNAYVAPGRRRANGLAAGPEPSPGREREQGEGEKR
ncbi:hypothetical protein R1flu_011363 [Riccia fluitans]|uniref:Uncharacterized protein n=1 Tax=Riccia fluitans TaxID=41844 RepID=A0ABD1Z7L2_9MARC